MNRRLSSTIKGIKGKGIHRIINNNPNTRDDGVMGNQVAR